MEFKTEKLVRFSQDGKQQSQIEKTNSAQSARKPSHSDDVPSTFQRKFDSIDKIFYTLNLEKSMVFSEDHDPWQRRILDPGIQLVLKWNWIFLISCLVALFIDPLYFYLPSIGDSSCMKMDLNLSIAVTCFRSIADLFYLSHMVLKCRLAYVAPSSRVFGKGELVMDSKKVVMRYLRSNFLIDLFAMLPLPQIVIWFIIPTLRRTNADYANNALALIVLFQYIPRLYLIFSLSSQIIKATGVVTKTAWAGAVYNLLLYMLASHVLGASWYLLSIERQATCWRSECRKESMLINRTSCNFDFFDCDTVKTPKRQRWANNTHVFQNCDPNRHVSFIFGIFADALTNEVVSSNFLEKYFYCLWWGLQNLSSYGQTLKTSTFIGETLFAILIVIVGLVLFAHLIGNMQTYLQSITVRLEEWRLERRDTEKWMKHRQLPQNL